MALDEIKYVDEQVSGRQHWTSGVGGVLDGFTYADEQLRGRGKGWGVARWGTG